MKTLEQFELELIKIKGQVGPEHVGSQGKYLRSNGDPCIMGRFLLNQGVRIMPRVGEYLLFDPLHLRHELERWTIGTIQKEPVYGMEVLINTNSQICALFYEAMRLNDAGYTWHSIVDELVPPVKHPYLMQAIEATVVEETKSKIAAVEPQEKIAVTV